MKVVDQSVQNAVFTPEMLWERALVEVDKAYDTVNLLWQTVEDIHTQPVCAQWAQTANRHVASEVRLFDRGATVNIVEWLEPRPDDVVPNFHRFLAVCLSGLEPRIMDGTWQQFVPAEKRTPELPKILAGPLESVVSTVTNAGVEDRFLRIWTSATILPKWS